MRYRCLPALLALVLASIQAPLAFGQSREAVSLELVLLVDVSASVAADEYMLQTNGLAEAFKSRPVLEAIRSLRGKGLAITVIQWADEAHQAIAMDWSVLRSEADASRFGTRLARMQRLIQGGHTALGDALAFALEQLNTNAYAGLRRVIDLSGDGRSNDGRPLAPTRADVLEQGITINGLAIVNELPLLTGYFRDQLIGGEGAFVVSARDYTDFARAIREKLEREIRSAPVAQGDSPTSSGGVQLGLLSKTEAIR